MKLSLKKLVAITSLGLATLGTYYGYKTFSGGVKLLEVLEYVQEHPEHNEEIVNHSIRRKIKDNIPYSITTLKTFSEVVLYQAIQNQITASQNNSNFQEKNSNTGYTRKNQSVLDNLTPEEKWALIQEGLLYRSKKLVNDTSEIGNDLYDKMKETKLYESIGGRK